MPQAAPDERDPRAYAARRGYAARIGPIRGPHELYLLVAPLAARQEVENVWIVCVDRDAMLLSPPIVVARGQVDHVAVDLPDAFAPASRLRAAGVAAVHNHPSGYATPSWHDARLSLAMRDAAHTLGMSWLDHVVIGWKQFYSFTERKLWRVRG